MVLSICAGHLGECSLQKFVKGTSRIIQLQCDKYDFCETHIGGAHHSSHIEISNSHNKGTTTVTAGSL